jgi:hypothetical protein
MSKHSVRGCDVAGLLERFAQLQEKACSAFTRVAACTLALSPIRDTLIEGFSHFVTSMTAPIASGWSGCRVGLAPTGKRRLFTAHATSRHSRPSRNWLIDPVAGNPCGGHFQAVPDGGHRG